LVASVREMSLFAYSSFLSRSATSRDNALVAQRKKKKEKHEDSANPRSSQDIKRHEASVGRRRRALLGDVVGCKIRGVLKRKRQRMLFRPSRKIKGGGSEGAGPKSLKNARENSTGRCPYMEPVI